VKSIFLSEMGWDSRTVGKLPRTYENMRVEFAWMIALDADHANIGVHSTVEGYDSVFVILPKLKTKLSADASPLPIDIENPFAEWYDSEIIKKLKSNNKKVYIIQEGPNWMFNDYEIAEQFNYYACLLASDGIFVHNYIDKKFFDGILLGDIPVNVIPTVMIDDLLTDIKPSPDDTTLIGGNFSRWYGGFQSYIVARSLGQPIFAQTSHSTRTHEKMIDDITHMERLEWVDWMKRMSKFKNAVHLMPTVAAGTFSLNCAYFGIPCIGNKDVDTQKYCHPELSVDVNDVESAVKLAIKLRDDSDFHQACSDTAKQMYNQHYTETVWRSKMEKILL